MNEQENKMGVMPINSLLLSMAVPIMISMLVQALYNIVDSIFVAKVSENAFTAVSLAFPVQSLMIAVATGTGVGINALLSRGLGEKKQEFVDKIANHAVILAIFSSILFMVLGLVGARFFFAAQTDIVEIVDGGTKYLTIVCVCSLPLFLQVTFERTLQATGRTLYSMISQGSGAIINIILDPIFIFGLLGMPKMGVAGAALATVIGQTGGMLIGLYLNVKKNPEIHFSFKQLRPDFDIIKRIYAIGIPSIAMSSLMSVTTFCLNRILIGFSTTATNVLGVYYKLQSFIFMPVFGLNNAMIPIIGYNYGARKKDRIFKTMKLSAMYAISIMLIGLAVFELFPHILLRMFNPSEMMLELGVPALRIICISFIFAGFCIVCSSVFQALGVSMYSLILSVCRQLVVLVPAAYLLSKLGDVNLVWWAFPIAEVMSVVCCIFFLRKIVKLLDF